MKTTKQQGFTLIELVIVIIILGILAVTAAPKFLNLSSDARASTMKGLEAAIKGGANLVYSKAAIAGEEANGDADAALTDPAVDVRYGYPDSTAFADAQILLWLDVALVDWDIDGSDARDGDVTFVPAGFTPAADTCEVIYTPAVNAGDSPVVQTNTDGC
ncbi:prepilin-type N-terminal cleavage/methylation domain-containing protein [Agarivorans sp. MS3-6]